MRRKTVTENEEKSERSKWVCAAILVLFGLAAYLYGYWRCTVKHPESGWWCLFGG